MSLTGLTVSAVCLLLGTTIIIHNKTCRVSSISQYSQGSKKIQEAYYFVPNSNDHQSALDKTSVGDTSHSPLGDTRLSSGFGPISKQSSYTLRSDPTPHRQDSNSLEDIYSTIVQHQKKPKHQSLQYSREMISGFLDPALVMVGGVDYSGHTSGYSTPALEVIRQPHACSLQIENPPRTVVKPLVGLVDNLIILCDSEYTSQYPSPDNYRCWKYNLEHRMNGWRSIRLPLTKLSLQIATAYKDYFFLLGGTKNDKDGSKQVQIYNSRTDRWSRGPPLPAPLYEGCTVGTHKGLFVVGSFEETDNPRNTMPAYLFKDNKWHQLPLLPFDDPNPGCGLGKINNKWVVVVVSGNQPRYHSLSTSLSERWHPLPPLEYDHVNVASVGMDGKNLVVSGGVSDWPVIEELEEVAEVVGGRLTGKVAMSWKTVRGNANIARKEQGTLQVPSYLIPECATRIHNL